jgi:hypothetical protein
MSARVTFCQASLLAQARLTAARIVSVLTTDGKPALYDEHRPPPHHPRDDKMSPATTLTSAERDLKMRT